MPSGLPFILASLFKYLLNNCPTWFLAAGFKGRGWGVAPRAVGSMGQCWTPGTPASGVSRSCFPAASTKRFSGSRKILMPLTILKNPAKTPLLEKAFWERNDLLYQVFRCSNSTLFSKGTECGWGTDTEPSHGPVFPLPEIGFCREGMQGDRLWNIWKLRGKKAGGSQDSRWDRPGHFTSLKHRWLVYLALRPRWPLDLDFSLGNLVCKYPTAYHS